ncbi:glycoside hydrolase family 32 protein [Labilibacter sediminis]|nr:glycoside hydrolase family 32 protein [Labilibacter sediminis]
MKNTNYSIVTFLACMLFLTVNNQAANAQEKSMIAGSHIIFPLSNTGKQILIQIHAGDKGIQNLNITLPTGDEPYWFAAYPLTQYQLPSGSEIVVKAVNIDEAENEKYAKAFEIIRSGTEEEVYRENDYDHSYRDQFHASSRHGWLNDPNGMVYHNGVYHLYYQYNPVGTNWGNMHWGHWTSKDMIHWEEHPIALHQNHVKDMKFSGGGFVDHNNTSGLGENALFVAYTSTGRGECLGYSKDGGMTFTELKGKPVVKHRGRDPKIIWYEPEKKWVMTVLDYSENEITLNTPPAEGHEKHPQHKNSNMPLVNMAFYESKDLHTWTRTGSFTDAQRLAVYECPELFELSVVGKPDEKHWIVYGVHNQMFIGEFDGKTFHKKYGPEPYVHQIFRAAQIFSDTPDGRRIQIGWINYPRWVKEYPDMITSQSMSLPQELTLHQTNDGLKVFRWPVEETKQLRSVILAEGKNLSITEANKLLQVCGNKETEVLIEFENSGTKELMINGIQADFKGRSARIFTDRNFNEVFADQGAFFRVNTRKEETLKDTETKVNSATEEIVKSLVIYQLKSIWQKEQ